MQRYRLGTGREQLMRQAESKHRQAESGQRYRRGAGKTGLPWDRQDQAQAGQSGLAKVPTRNRQVSGKRVKNWLFTKAGRKNAGRFLLKGLKQTGNKDWETQGIYTLGEGVNETQVKHIRVRE